LTVGHHAFLLFADELAAKKTAAAEPQMPVESIVCDEPAVVEAAGAVKHAVTFISAAVAEVAARQRPVDNTE
jgi:hypothetical protein